jgi:signal transduction histidine kinase
MIRLAVADRGIGMEDETLQMAGQVNFSTKTNGSGSTSRRSGRSWKVREAGSQ